MPSIIYIRPPEGPTRRKQRGVEMTTTEPCPYKHKECNQEAILYADGVIWCEECGRKITHEECTDMSRGKGWVGRVYSHVQRTRAKDSK